ncbi:putative lipoprotein [Streptomyces filipinensis]|uniref:Lipoprotein n=1 Tax=Streptomyces filipinensis TaxID=66887 RepID=A0A918MDN0_9ACTN|nr:hypothetical protein [Streptomyces filipinensis]GGV07496.1 putative lipoprotein [Streptomyces filipinensis]
MSNARIASAAAVLVLAAGLTGCGSGDGTRAGGDAQHQRSATPPVRAVQDAYRTTVAAGTAKLTVTSTAEADGQTLTARGSGVADLKDGASRVTLASQGTTIEQRVLDGVVYQKPSGRQRGAVPGGRTWLKIDLRRLAAKGSAGQSRVSDPAEPVRYLRNVSSRNVTRLGEQTLDGTRTTHYRVSVPVSALSRGDAARARELRQQLGTSSLPVDLWLDGPGRLRRESVRLTLHPLKGRTPGRGNTTMVSTTVLRFSGFGTEAEVSAPPAQDTADVTDRLAEAGAARG